VYIKKDWNRSNYKIRIEKKTNKEEPTLIRKIFICTQTGLKIFYKNYDNYEFFDEDLFGGYLSLISSYVRENLDGKMYSMEKNEFGVLFEYGDSILVSAIYDLEDNRDIVKIALGLIKDVVQIFFREEINAEVICYDRLNEIEEVVDDTILTLTC